MKKANTKNTKKNDGIIENPLNEVRAVGVVTKVVCSTEKMAIYNVDIQSKTPKGNTVHTWVNVVDFAREFDFEENDILNVTGRLECNKFESGKYGTQWQIRIVADTIMSVDEIPNN